MQKILVIISILLLVSACSVQSKLKRKYEGEGSEQLILNFGAPTSIVEKENGDKLYIYIKETHMRAVEINTGSFTTDKRISPALLKVEKKIFLISKDGIIKSSWYEKNYE